MKSASSGERHWARVTPSKPVTTGSLLYTWVATTFGRWILFSEPLYIKPVKYENLVKLDAVLSAAPWIHWTCSHQALGSQVAESTISSPVC